jgi:hypothetical protein
MNLVSNYYNFMFLFYIEIVLKKFTQNFLLAELESET